MPSSSMKFFRALNPYPAHPVRAGFEGLRPSFSEAPTDPGAVLKVKRSPAENVTAKFGAFPKGLLPKGPGSGRDRLCPDFTASSFATGRFSDWASPRIGNAFNR
jgi:hypothetical protein